MTQLAKNRMRSYLMIAAMGITVLCAGCYSAQRAAKMEAAAAARSELTGQMAPDFTLDNQDGEPVTLSDYRGKWVVLYFYPADGTPGCTCQAREFTRNFGEFQQMSAEVFGISPDTVKSHRQVTDQFDLKVPLLADPERKVMTAYGAWVTTPFQSRPVRSTVLIDPDGRVAYHWPEVIPQGHAARVKTKAQEIQSSR